MSRIVLIIIATLLISCGKSMEVQIEELVSAKNTWLEASKSRNYSYKISINSAGNSKALEYQVSVVGGASTSSLPSPGNGVPDLSNIQGIYKYIFGAIKNPEQKVSAEYHSELGYPTYIKVSKPNIMDSMSIITVKYFEFENI